MQVLVYLNIFQLGFIGARSLVYEPTVLNMMRRSLVGREFNHIAEGTKKLFSRSYDEEEYEDSQGQCMPLSSEYDSDPAVCDYYEPGATSINSTLLLNLVNTLRRNPDYYAESVGVDIPEYELDMLKYNNDLEQASTIQSNDMDRCQVCGHRIVEDSNLSTRVDQTGFDYSHLAENVLFNCYDMYRYKSLIKSGSFNEEHDNFKLWRASPGHLKNMLLPDITHLGVARVGPYWTMTLGTINQPRSLLSLSLHL